MEDVYFTVRKTKFGQNEDLSRDIAPQVVMFYSVVILPFSLSTSIA